MSGLIKYSRCLALLLLLGMGWPAVSTAADSSSFGQIVIPNPSKPADAEACVEPVEVMRRDHMKFLMHQRDATVIDADRSPRYSLVGCMNCHNPAGDEIVRYEDPQHFCADCHRYASVKIDCFECHADRGLVRSRQSRLVFETPHEQLQTFRLRQQRVD